MFLLQFTIIKIFSLVQALVYLSIWAFLRQVYQIKLWQRHLISLLFADLPSLLLIHHYQRWDFASSTHEYNLLQYSEPSIFCEYIYSTSSSLGISESIPPLECSVIKWYRALYFQIYKGNLMWQIFWWNFQNFSPADLWSSYLVYRIQRDFFPTLNVLSLLHLLKSFPLLSTSKNF